MSQETNPSRNARRQRVPLVALVAMLIISMLAISPAVAQNDDTSGPTVQGTYQLVNTELGLYVDADGNNVALTGDASVASEWEVIADDGALYFRSTSTLNFLDADGRNQDFNVDELDDLARTEGRWVLSDAGDGNYFIANLEYDRYLYGEAGPDYNVRTAANKNGAGSVWTLVATGAAAAPAPATGLVQFTVENLQPADGFFFTPVWTGLHNGDFDLFEGGERASEGLEILAETGDTAPLSEEFEARGRLQTTVHDGPIGPGAVVTGAIEIINPAAYPYVSFASMIIPSNDGFFGNDDPAAYQLFDENGAFTGPVTIDIIGSEIYDSGTEVNTGQGAAGFSLGFDGQGSGESTDDPTGTVAIHPDRFENLIGLQTAAGTTIGSDGGGYIEEGEAVARITIDVVPAPTFEGAVYVGTNGLDANEIAAFGQSADGTLTPLGNFATGGQGSTEFDGGEGLDPLISADSVVVTEDEKFLLAVNAGSDTISSFAINDDFSLTLVSEVASGGVGPNSIAVDNGLVFVTNIDRDGLALGDPNTPRAEPNDEGNVVGFSLSATGELAATGYSADLDNRPANIGFTTDGDRVIVSSITSGSAALPGENAEASIYAFKVLRSGRLVLSDTGTPTLRGNEEGRNLPSAIDFDIATIDGSEYVVVTEAREFNSEGAPPAFPALQAGSVTVYEISSTGKLNITEADFALTSGDPAADNEHGANGQQLTACWIDFGVDGRTFYVSNAINATISSLYLEDDGTVTVLDTIAAAGTSAFETEGEVIDGPTAFGRTDGFIDLDVNPSGEFLYQLEGLSGNIGVYAIDHDGSLSLVQEVTGELPEIDTQGIISVGAR